MPVEPETRRECLEFELRLDAGVSDEVGEHEWGRSFLCPSLPLLWDASWVVIEEPRLGFAEIEAPAEEVLGAAGVRPTSGGRLRQRSREDAPPRASPPTR